MKLKYVALALIGLVVGVAISYAIYSMTGTQTATSTGLSVLLNDIPLEQDSVIAWGDIELAILYSANLSVTNNNPSTVIVHLYCTGLPVGWTETWDANGTALMTGESTWGWLNLTATTIGSETWSWNITAT